MINTLLHPLSAPPHRVQVDLCRNAAIKAPMALSDARDPVECDITEQAGWLAQQSAERGYSNLDELLSKAPDVYLRLAVLWRRTHPLFKAA
ncbi:MAG: hypothetical protein ACT4NU_06660 [Chromatiales bacterium]